MIYKDVLIITNELTEAPDLVSREEAGKVQAYQHIPLDQWYFEISAGRAVLEDYIYISPYPEGDGVPLLSMHRAETSDPYCKYGAFFDWYIAPVEGTSFFGLYAKTLKLTDLTGKGKEIMDNVLNNHTFNLSLTYSFLEHEAQALDSAGRKTCIVKAKKIKLTEVSIVNAAAYSLAGFNLKNIKNYYSTLESLDLGVNNFKISNSKKTMDNNKLLEECLKMLQQMSNQASTTQPIVSNACGEEKEVSNSEKESEKESEMEVSNSDKEEEMEVSNSEKEAEKEAEKESEMEVSNSEEEKEVEVEVEETEDEDMEDTKKIEVSNSKKIKNTKTNKKIQMDILKELIATQVEQELGKKNKVGAVEVALPEAVKPNFTQLIKDLESPALKIRNSAKKNLFLSALDLVEKQDDRDFLKQYAEKNNVTGFTFDLGKVKNTITSSFLPAVYTYLTKEVELDVYEQKDLFDIFMATKGDISMHQRRANGLAGEYINAAGDIFDLNSIPGFVGSADIPLPIRLEGKADFISEGERPVNAISMFNAITCKFHYKLGITLPVTKEAELLDIYGIIPKVIQKIGSFFQRTKNEALVKCLFGVNSDIEKDMNQTRLVDKLSHIAYSVRNSNSNTIKAYNRPLFLTAAQATGKYAGEEVNFIENLDPTIDNIYAQMTDMLRSKSYKFLDPNNISESIFNQSQVRVILPLALRKDFISLTQQVTATSYLQNFESINTNPIIRSGGYYNLESSSNYHTLYSLNENKSLQLMFVDFNELMNKTAYKAARSWFIVISHPDIPAIYHDTISNMKDYDFMMEDGVMTNYAFYQYYSFGFMNPYAIRKFTATYDINPNVGNNVQF